MKDLVVDVFLWGKCIGALAWDYEKEVASFQYEDSFIRSGLDVSPITMPLSRGSSEIYQFLQNRNNCFHGLPGLIADSLPDKFGSEIINEWFISQGRDLSEVTPLDRLCYVGRRGMGALEFQPSKHLDGLDQSSKVHIEELTRFADTIYQNRENFQELLRQENKGIIDILKIGTSAGGAKPKAIIALNEQTSEIRSGQVEAPEGFNYWLLKFDGTSYSEGDKVTSNPRGIGNIEYAYYRMAVDSGICMMESRLLSDGDNNHFMTKRFDRSESGEKKHVLTLAGMAHFNRDQRFSYEDGFNVIRRLRLPYPDQEEFFRRMVFNVLSRNHDDHTKNHSFLMDKKGRWSLAPAYDLCYSYSPSGRWTNQHQMSIHGKRANFTYQDILSVGQHMGINKPEQILERTSHVISKWYRYAKDCGVCTNHAKQIQNNLLLLRGKQLSSFSSSLSM